ncbi:antennal-specific protein OS-C isoform X2 [Drosophila yakuba]|uniref:antennal-specific protein OS-C isoform X2 n=1 Tax=Drosophila yakuba TaxID=7245 RepID=UPI0019308A84|nr:antennal-specific protein OS-C isoform X2 [Drosophila yakuba]XP_039491640.1 antennal-specific protein OS-C isoform X1 [Drosophila santomea]
MAAGCVSPNQVDKMGFHMGRQLLLSGFLLVMLQVLSQTQARPQDVITVAGEETEVVIKQEGDGDDDDSSSEETVEDSEESRRRRREVNTDNTPSARAVIPGLPDPATIIKIAELFQSVGEQVVPILVEAILPSVDEAGDRFARSLPFLKKLTPGSELFATEKNE